VQAYVGRRHVAEAARAQEGERRAGRGLAFARPTIVLGAAGFARIFEAAATEDFLRTGLFGTGRGEADMARLQGAIDQLVSDPGLRARLGWDGLDFVTRHHGLDGLTDDLARICRTACADHRPRSLWDAGYAAWRYLRERRFQTASRDRA
jgi:hypothetical protein